MWVLWIWLATSNGKALSAPVAVSDHATELLCESAKLEWVGEGGGRFKGRCVPRLRAVLPPD